MYRPFLMLSVTVCGGGLGLAHTSSLEFIVCISSQLCVLVFHIGSLQLFRVGVLIPQKLAIATNQDLWIFFSLKTWLLSIYEHPTDLSCGW